MHHTNRYQNLGRSIHFYKRLGRDLYSRPYMPLSFDRAGLPVLKSQMWISRWALRPLRLKSLLRGIRSVFYTVPLSPWLVITN